MRSLQTIYSRHYTHRVLKVGVLPSSPPRCTHCHVRTHARERNTHTHTRARAAPCPVHPFHACGPFASPCHVHLCRTSRLHRAAQAAHATSLWPRGSQSDRGVQEQSNRGIQTAGRGLWQVCALPGERSLFSRPVQQEGVPQPRRTCGSGRASHRASRHGVSFRRPGSDGHRHGCSCSARLLGVGVVAGRTNHPTPRPVRE